MNQDLSLLDRYLLGRSTPEETDALELRLLTDGALFETAEALEFELLERAARGELSPEEDEALALRLASSRRLNERLAFSRALIDIARTPPAVGRGGLGAWLSRLLSPAARPAWAAAALASIGAIWLASQNVDLRQELKAVAAIEEKATELQRENDRVQAALREQMERGREVAEAESRLRAEYTRSQQRTSELEARLASREPERRLVALSLTATTRSGANIPTLKLGPDETHVQIELDLPAQMGPAPWTATLERDTVAIWTEAHLVVDRSSLGVIGRFEIPRQSLVEGRYDIVVRSATGTVATFPLTVERP